MTAGELAGTAARTIAARLRAVAPGPSQRFDEARQASRLLVVGARLRAGTGRTRTGPALGEPRRILHYVGIGSMALSPVEIALHHQLRAEGCQVDYLVYDESIPITEVTTREQERTGGRQVWEQGVRSGRRLLRAAGVPYQTISVDPEAERIARSMPDLASMLHVKLGAIDFGEIVASSISRYYRSTSFERIDGVEEVARRILTTALTNYFEIRRRLTDHDYDLVLCSHGIYMTWAPVTEYCRLAGVDVVCYDRAKTRGHFTFNVNQPSPDWSFDTAWDRYAERELTEAERSLALSYLADRELQTGDVYAYNHQARSTDVSEVRQQLGIPEGAACITLFTNLIWDAANASRDLVFGSMLDCAVETIEHFAERPDVVVLLRTHPAETVLGTDERYGELVRRHFGHRLPANVRVLDDTVDLNSFTVVDLSDVGVVNTSTVGLEMALEGKPVVVVGGTHYRGKGFTIDPLDRSEYFAAVSDQLGDRRTAVDRDLALKYFYLMMFEYQQEVPTWLVEPPRWRDLARSIWAPEGSNALPRIARELAQPALPPDFVDWA